MHVVSRLVYACCKQNSQRKEMAATVLLFQLHKAIGYFKVNFLRLCSHGA